MRKRLRILLSLPLAAVVVQSFAVAQSTQSILTGSIIDRSSGQPITGATVRVEGASPLVHQGRSSPSGWYSVTGLSAGAYQITVIAAGFQSQLLREVELPVSSILELNFSLRPEEDVWESGLKRSFVPQGGLAVLTFIGPDLDARRIAPVFTNRAREAGFESARSTIVTARQLRLLPLGGRDAYAFLALIGGVTTDAGTARGLGLSANGQRPSASGFLLDGVENNNDLVTGPLNPLPPEALQEYRISTGHYTAEFGRNSGILANAITRAGDRTGWHGLGYFYANREGWNANAPQRNRNGVERARRREHQPGLVLSGPLWRERVFASLSGEYLRNRTEGDPQEFLLPATSYRQLLVSGGAGRQLLDRFPAPFAAVNLVNAPVTLSPPEGVDRRTSLGRLDYVPDEASHSRFFLRVLDNRLRRPFFIWTPYEDFTTPMEQTSRQVALAALHNPMPTLTTELRASLAEDDLRWDRRYPGIPTLESADGTLLPGSPAFYSFRNRGRRKQLTGNVSWVHNGHVVKFGGELLLRRIVTAFAPGSDGRFRFDGLFDFGAGTPFVAEALILRGSESSPAVGGGDTHFGNRQAFLFAQDTWRVHSRLTVTMGLRWEYFGNPRNRGLSADARVEFGRGSTLAEQVAEAKLVVTRGGSDPVYAADWNNVAPRIGASLRLTESPKLFLRGSYGIYYDRPFDNLWQNTTLNRFSYLQAVLPASAGINRELPSLPDSLRAGFGIGLPFPELAVFQPALRTPFVHSYSGGVRYQIAESLLIEADVSGAMGRQLLTTDRINRPFGTAETFDGRWNPRLPVLAWRANQGVSDYHGLSVSAFHTSGTRTFRASYTWSHAIDNQSEPLAGDFFNLSFTRLNLAESGAASLAAFSFQGDPSYDRGNSDFDQRHSLTLWGMWEFLPGWNVASVASVRSGTPLTVFASSLDAPAIYNRRANQVAADPYQRRAGRWLNPSSFAAPAPGIQGTLGRNALSGPGAVSMDVSISRSFRVPGLGESGKAVLRLDAYNVLNHSNLGPVETTLDAPDFGVAAYGRVGRRGFPSLTPFQETARIVQAMVQLHF